MAKIKLTRPELKRQRDFLARYERFLPTLKLKQQQLQLTMRQVQFSLRAIEEQTGQAQQQFAPYSAVLGDLAGVDVRMLADAEEIITSSRNIAGVTIPVFEDIRFPQTRYSLFATPPWLDRALADLRTISTLEAQQHVLRRQYELLDHELTKIIQRVNLFEKVKIPQTREAIRVIRIRLGDEMTAAVGRAKIAKGKISDDFVASEAGLARAEELEPSGL
jgi:V/A-type H+-transporting ATPase subunit D